MKELFVGGKKGLWVWHEPRQENPKSKVRTVQTSLGSIPHPTAPPAPELLTTHGR